MTFHFIYLIYNINKSHKIMNKEIKQKKVKVSFSITKENYEKLEELKTNKSQLINWLLKQHFSILK